MNNIKKLFAAAIICAATFVGYNTYKQATMTEEERFIQANIDALTEDEEDQGSCTASLACSVVNAEQNYVSCSGKKSCERNAAERWVKCDGVKSSC